MRTAASDSERGCLTQAGWGDEARWTIEKVAGCLADVKAVASRVIAQQPTTCR